MSQNSPEDIAAADGKGILELNSSSIRASKNLASLNPVSLATTPRGTALEPPSSSIQVFTETVAYTEPQDIPEFGMGTTGTHDQSSAQTTMDVMTTTRSTVADPTTEQDDPDPDTQIILPDGFRATASDRTDLTSNVKSSFWNSLSLSINKPPKEYELPRTSILRNTTKQQTSVFRSTARHIDHKVIGLGDYGLDANVMGERQHQFVDDESSQKSFPFNKTNLNHRSVEQMEEEARAGAITNPWYLLMSGTSAAFKILCFYLITLETILACLLTTGFTCYWYFANLDNAKWYGGGLDFILLAFTVTTSIATAVSLSFTRRERALIAVGDFRTFSHHLMLAHCLWDWNENGGRTEAAKKVDWVEHVDAVMAQLIGIGDELSRFLTLPTTSRSRHRMTAQGRKEARRTMEAAYHLIDSIETQRMTRLILYSERLKKIGLPSGEVSRIRQYERFISVNVEQLRLIKMYRTPQALRSFARIFTVFLPPFYSPTFAQVARETGSLGMGICFGIIACLCLTCLFESLQVLEDPFTAFLALDGIDVREEFEVLHFAQLVNTRQIAFPDAPPYPAGRRAALIAMTDPKSLKKLHHLVGLPPVQAHHGGHSRKPSEINLSLFTSEQEDDNKFSEAEFVDHEDLELGTPLFPGVHYDARFSRDPLFSDDEAASVHTPPGLRGRHHRRAASSASDSMSRSGRGMSLSQRLTRRVLRDKASEPAVWNGEGL